MQKVFNIIAFILGYIIGLALSSLIFWGIGTFILWAFRISFTWTYWHGLATTFVVLILKSIFTSNSKN